MGLIQDVGGKLVQSFLSLDDLVLGQGLISEGLSQLGLSGRSVAGSALGSANVAVRSVHATIQVGAKTARATAAVFEGFVPGAGLARSMAERMDGEATAAGLPAVVLQRQNGETDVTDVVVGSGNRRGRIGRPFSIGCFSYDWPQEHRTRDHNDRCDAHQQPRRE